MIDDDLPAGFLLLPTVQRSSDSHAAGVCCTRGRSAGGKRTHPPEAPPDQPDRAGQSNTIEVKQGRNPIGLGGGLGCVTLGARPSTKVTPAQGEECRRGERDSTPCGAVSGRPTCASPSVLGGFPPFVGSYAARMGEERGRRSQQTQTLPSAAVE